MRYFRKVIQITAEDSPNVRLGLAQRNAGLVPTNEILVPGVLSYYEYEKRLKTWDEIRKTVGLWAKFYVGRQLYLYPPANLVFSIKKAFELRNVKRVAKAIGCDPAEGGDKSTWSVIDELGLLELISIKTPDTSVIPGITLDLMRRYQVPPERMCFDRGGGGQQHADNLRDHGFAVRSVGFGSQIELDIKRVKHQVPTRIEQREDKYVFINRRGQLFGELAEELEVYNGGFAIPNDTLELQELHRQLSLIPKKYDQEGRLKIPPKNVKPGQKENEGGSRREKTLVEIIGHSPDELDSLSLAVHAMLHKKVVAKAGVA